MKSSRAQRPLTIAISGSHSTGKTSLAAQLQQALTKLSFSVTASDEPIRQLEHGNKLRAGGPGYLKLLTIHFERLNRCATDLLLLDRSLIDFWSYLHVEQQAPPEIIALTEQLLPAYLSQVDHHFFLPIEFSVKADGYRPIDEGFRKKISDEILTGVADEQHSQLTGSPTQRISRALAVIHDLIETRAVSRSATISI